MLELRYKQDQQLIQVHMTQNLQYWPIIRMAIEENASDITFIGPYHLSLPVWAFYSCRKGLAYVLNKNQIPYILDDEVRRILEYALTREAEYKHAIAEPLISKEQLLSKLRSVGFIRSLTNEQIRNVIKLSTLPSGATFSVPGAGKTTEALAFYYYKKTINNKLLVVCPKITFSAWEEQLNLCLQSPPSIVRLVGGEKAIVKALESSAEIFLITYQQLPNVKTEIAKSLIKSEYFMFLDESHRIKRGIGGQWCDTVLSLAHLPKHKLIMSGTPLPNSISDLIPQFNFIYPEVETDQENIQYLIKPIFVRTTKAELNLPPVKRVETFIQLPPQLRNYYELLRSEEARKISNLRIKDKTKFRYIGKSIMRLLQLVSNPALLLKSSIDLPDDLYKVLIEGDSPKIEYACYKARKLASQGKKTIIWSNFVENVETISLRLFDIGADFIHGGVEAGTDEEAETRERKILRFHNDPNAFVLVANPAACAEGISLHSVCHHAIYVDRNYNAAQYLQSEDRIHRLGLKQDETTVIELLVSPDTIDESVKRRLTAKVAKMAKILNDNSLNIETIEPELEQDGIDSDDINDFIFHLSGE